MKFTAYETDNFYDEMFVSDSTPRPGARLLKERIESLPDGELFARQAAAESLLLQNGITFNVYGDNAATENIFPFDVIPRIIEAAEWEWIEKGLKQRVYALNLFIDDIYHEQKIVKDNISAGVVDPFGALVSPGLCRTESAAEGLVPHYRHRSGARPRRPNVCSGRQSALSVRGLVRAGKPPDHEADLSAGLRSARGCGRWTIIRATCYRPLQSLLAGGDASRPRWRC